MIDEVEPIYLKLHGDYWHSPNRSGKYFALTSTGAAAFAKAPMNQGTTITTTALPQSLPTGGTTCNDPGQHGAGLSVFFPEQLLREVYAKMRPPDIWQDAER